MALIAKVMVAAMVDGKRKEFQPGEELPEMNAHDVASLKAMGAIEDPAETAKAGKANLAAEKVAAKEFAAARQATLAATASTTDGAVA